MRPTWPAGATRRWNLRTGWSRGAWNASGMRSWLKWSAWNANTRLSPKHAALSLSAAQRKQIRRLAQDLPALWQAPTTTFAQRKQLVRWLIKDVTLSKRGNRIDLSVRW